MFYQKSRTLFATRSHTSNVARRAGAIGTVVVNGALGWFYARVVFGTRVNAFGVYARFVAGTIGVGATSRDHACYLRISGHSWWTFAHGLMVDTVALGRRAATASVRGARGHADAIHAHVLTGTVGLASTSGWKRKSETIFYNIITKKIGIVWITRNRFLDSRALFARFAFLFSRIILILSSLGSPYRKRIQLHYTH